MPLPPDPTAASTRTSTSVSSRWVSPDMRNVSGLGQGLEKIGDFIVRITGTYEEIEEVWLMGSRANGTARPDSDWDLLVFADEPTFRRMRKNHRLRRAEIDCLVVRGGNEFREPWGRRPKHGDLCGWGWTKMSKSEAEYDATKWVEDEDGGRTISKRCRAIRIWPRQARVR